MVMHARSGGDIEVMGLMIGHVERATFIVTDALRLPVEGTETRVNAATEADEYMINFLMRSREVGQQENAVGWYHSHPGYGCWLSGIDVTTQNTNQSFQDPFLAVVIDPHRTISAGKVEIGAFRTYPEGYKPEGQDSSSDAAVPMAKAADFGAHAHRYYPLEVSHYKSTLDNKLLEALWNKYWVQTLSSSPLFTNRDYVAAQIQDLAGKAKQVEDGLQHRSSLHPMGPSKGKFKPGEEQLAKVVKSAEKIANEEKMGLMAAMVKEKVFGAQAGQVALAADTVEVNSVADTHMADVKAA